MSEPQIWYLQDGNVQSQAGKVFVHQQGPLLKFPPSQDSVDNSCLCKYRYMRYYAFYAYVSKTPYPHVQVYQDFQLPQEQEQDDVQFRNYDLQDPEPQGYQWLNWDGPVYIGCHPQGSFTCGVWLPVQLPYPTQQQFPNTTVPAPSYIYETQDPQNKSLLCMIVCSYKCCNGKKGCGEQLVRPGPDMYCGSFPISYAQYYVTGLSNQDSSKHVATLIQGTQGCICQEPFCIQRKYIQHDCDSATVKAFKELNLLPPWDQEDCAAACIQAREDLPQIAKSWAKAEGNWQECVYWLLWKWTLPQNCDPCAVSQLVPINITDLEDVPSQVAGKGIGWMPKNFHSQQRMDYCNPQGGGTSYQWTYSVYNNPTLAQILQTMPGRLTQNPCKEACKTAQDQDQGKISDSLSGFIGTGDVPQSQLPCNSPDAPGYIYKEFQHVKFNVWSLKLIKLSDTGISNLNNSDIDPCYDTYSLDPQSEDPTTGKLSWSEEQTALCDYQLQTYGYFLGTRFLNFRKDMPNKIFLALPQDEEPPGDSEDQRLSHLKFIQDTSGTVVQDTSKNKCLSYYQIYYKTDCRCQDPCQKPCAPDKQKVPDVFSSVCAKWRFIGKLSAQEIQYVPLCLNKWLESTVQNTFSTPQRGPIGDYVYTVSSQQQFFCGSWPEPPQKVTYYLRVIIKPQCPDGHSSLTATVESVTQACAAKIVQGFKLTDSFSNSQLLPVQNNQIDPLDACQIYYFRKLGQDLQGVYDASCQQKQLQPPSVPDPVFQTLPVIRWNLQKCFGGGIVYLGSQTGDDDPTQGYVCQQDIGFIVYARVPQNGWQDARYGSIDNPWVNGCHCNPFKAYCAWSGSNLSFQVIFKTQGEGQYQYPIIDQCCDYGEGVGDINNQVSVSHSGTACNRKLYIGGVQIGDFQEGTYRSYFRVDQAHQYGPDTQVWFPVDIIIQKC